MFTLYILPTPDEGIFSALQATVVLIINFPFRSNSISKWDVGIPEFTGVYLHKLNVQSLSREIWVSMVRLVGVNLYFFSFRMLEIVFQAIYILNDYCIK